VIVKEAEQGRDVADAVEALLAAVSSKDDAKVLSLIDVLKGTSASSAPAQDPIIEGQWRQIWSQQADDANPLQKRLSGNQSVRPSAVRHMWHHAAGVTTKSIRPHQHRLHLMHPWPHLPVYHASCIQCRVHGAHWSLGHGRSLIVAAT